MVTSGGFGGSGGVDDGGGVIIIVTNQSKSLLHSASQSVRASQLVCLMLHGQNVSVISDAFIVHDNFAFTIMTFDRLDSLKCQGLTHLLAWLLHPPAPAPATSHSYTPMA